MIQINLLSKDEQVHAEIELLKQDVIDNGMANALSIFHSRPANLRNPGSKKVKCHQCQTVLTLDELRTHGHTFVAPFTIRKDIHGNEEKIIMPVKFSKSLLKGRKKPHHSAKKLQLVERVRTKIPFPLPQDIDANDFRYLMHEARIDASRELRSERKAKAKKYRDTQKRSRAINRV